MKLIEQKLVKINDKISSFRHFKIDLEKLYEKYHQIKFKEGLVANEKSNDIIKELDEIEIELSKYDRLLNVLIEFNKIYKELLIYKVNEDTMRNMVKQVIDNFDNIICLKNDFDDIENQLLNKIYRIIYCIMKLEIVSINESNLFNYFANKDLSKQFLNELIKEDLIKIKKEFNKIEEYESDEEYGLKVLSINIDSLGECYSLETLKLILRYDTDNILYKFEVNNKFRILLSKREKIASNIASRLDCIKNNEFCLETLKTRCIKNKKDICARVGSIILSLGIMSGSFVLNSGNLKKVCTYKVYKGTETSYSTDYGMNETPIELEVSSNPIDSVKINVYSKVFDNQRTISTYDVSDITLSDIQDYLDINLDDLYYDISLISYDENTPDFEYSEVVITDINDNEIYETFYSSDYYLLSTLVISLTWLLCELTSVVCCYISKKEWCLGLGLTYNLCILFGKTKFNPSLYSQYESNMNEIKKTVSDIEKLKQEIDKLEIYDSEVKENFNKLYQQYSYLLTDANLFLNRFKIIDEQKDSKKLARRKEN